MSATPGACHNCRRGRLKCDRSLPRCQKCFRRGQSCLGYGNLWRWEKGMASRGRLTGVTSDDIRKIQKGDTASTLPAPWLSILSTPSPPRSLPRSLTDPFAQDLDYRSRRYIEYFASDVCRDLVLYDIPNHNPFRELVPMAYQQPMLFQTIIGSSALHMSNACQRSTRFSSMLTTQNSTNLPSSLSIGPCVTSLSETFHDALRAKQQALCLLKSALEDMASADVDVILAVVLLLIGFELIDSGRGSWIFHINGARVIIDKLIASTLATKASLSPLRSWLVSNCLVYDLLGSSFANSYLPHSGWPSTTTMSLLQDAEGNHCSSFPAALLPLIQAGAQLLKAKEVSPSPNTYQGLQDAFHLLHAAKSFDPAVWAVNLQPRSPANDLFHRIEIASAHRAAVCIYLSRIILSLWPSTVLPHDLETLVAEIIAHLSNMYPGDALFTATAWPAFIAGLETVDLGNRAWVVRRFQKLWEMEPWGLTREALGALRTIWGARGDGQPQNQEENWNWIDKLQNMDTDWLIA